LSICASLIFSSDDPARNRYRFYTLTKEQGPGRTWILRLTWGRIGCWSPHTLVKEYGSEAEMEEEADRVVQLRFRHGYQLVDKDDSKITGDDPPHTQATI